MIAKARGSMPHRRTGAPTPHPLIFLGGGGVNTQVNMQCIEYVCFSLFTLHKHTVCVKGHKQNPQTQESYRSVKF